MRNTEANLASAFPYSPLKECTARNAPTLQNNVVTQHNVARVQHAVVFNLGEIHFINNVLKHKKLFPHGNSFVLYE